MQHNNNKMRQEESLPPSPKPAWLEPELHQEAVRRIRLGDNSLSHEWIKLVTSRFAAITRSNMDQVQAALSDLQNLTNTGDPDTNKDVL